MESDDDRDLLESRSQANPNRSPRALPLPPVEWAPETPRPDARADFFERQSGMSEWRRRNGLKPSPRAPRVILAYPRSKKHYGRT